MKQLRIVSGRTLTTLWVVALGFLVLAQPAHALFESASAALIAQVFGAVLMGTVFALREAIRQQYERFSSFLVRSRGLRAVVRSLAVSTIAAPTARKAGADATSEAAAAVPNSDATELAQWQNSGGANAAASAETSPQIAVSAPQRPTPAFPTTTG
jgi:hypothetical protein